MKTLYLVRHAKSSWDYHNLSDVDRPLKGRGIRDAHLISTWLADSSDMPDGVYSSPATRALHTAMIFSRNFGMSFQELNIVDGLYMASVHELMTFCQDLSNDQESVMVFGHNPTITEFVNRCINQRIDNVPTTGVACLKFDINRWEDLEWDAELAFFDYPKNHKD